MFKHKRIDLYPLAEYGLGDEIVVPWEACLTPDDDKAYAAMLKERYGDTGKLNAEWGRGYASFDAVPHLSPGDAITKKQYPEWLAHRRLITKTSGNRLKVFAEEIKRRDPSAKSGCDGTWAGNGFNMEEVLANPDIGWWGLYSRLPESEILRSLRPDMDLTYVWGWVTPNETYPEAPWYNLLAGTGRHSNWFISGPYILGANLAADYRPFHEKLSVELEKLRRGPAQLLNSVPLKFDGMAIWESFDSNSASLLGDSRFVNPKDSALPLISIAYQSGINFDFIVRHNMAEKLKNYKVLFLCGASSLSQYEREQLLSYVKNGGTIVADTPPGLMNDSFKVLAGSQLPELFGDFKPESLPAPAMAPIKVAADLDGHAIKFDCEASSFPGIAPFTVRRHGKGRAVLLNFTLATAKLHCEPGAMDKFLLELLGACGIKPTVKTTGLPVESVVRVREGKGFELVGLTNRALALAGKDAGEGTLTFSKPGYIYEVGKGLAVKGDNVKFQFAPPFKLYALFDRSRKPPRSSCPARWRAPGRRCCSICEACPSVGRC